MAPLFFTDLESALREKEHLEKILAGMRKDYEAEIANLKSENRVEDKGLGREGRKGGVSRIGKSEGRGDFVT